MGPTWRHSLFNSLRITRIGPHAAEKSDDEQLKNVQLAEGEKKMSEKILLVLEHFKQKDPVGLPIVKIPDPFPIPDRKQSFSLATMNFKNMNMTGLNRLRILYVKAEIAAMEVTASLKIDKITVVGNYTMATWISSSKGPFTVNLTDLQIKAKANIGVTREGRLQAQDITMDIKFVGISMNFENLGFMGSIFQGLVNSIGSFLFDSIKPEILKEAYGKARPAINEYLDKFTGSMEFPNSISPLDMVVADLRKVVREKGYDPWKLENYNSTVRMFDISSKNTWIYGASSFHRVGNISITMINNSLIADIELGTQRLEGVTDWNIEALAGVMSRAGTASFSVEYISARIVLAQPTDTSQVPQLRDIQMELGNIQVRCDGAGTLDYVIEFVVNVLPNLLRYQIVDGLEFVAKEKLQKELDAVNVEEIIKTNLPELDEMKDTPFNITSILDSVPIKDVGMQVHNTDVDEEEDEFWKFD